MTTTWDTAPRRGALRSIVLFLVLGVLAFGIVVAIAVGSQYNQLVQLDQGVQSQWAQVQNAYQRRMDLVPNLVATVRGAASFERDTLTAVTEARAHAAQSAPTSARAATEDPAALARFQAAQEQLGGALGRLMVVVERYPDLHATQNFRDLQTQLEGTENRIAIERMRYNEAAQAFNARRDSFPTVIIANLFGSRFREKAYFTARAGAELPPEVRF